MLPGATGAQVHGIEAAEGRCLGMCSVQGLRGNVARTYAAGVEAPHDRAVEVLPPIDSSISPRVADLRSRPEDGHHRYK